MRDNILEIFKDMLTLKKALLFYAARGQDNGKLAREALRLVTPDFDVHDTEMNVHFPKKIPSAWFDGDDDRLMDVFNRGKVFYD